MLKLFTFFFCFLCIISCQKETIPKPKGYLSLIYPKNDYKKLLLKKLYYFEVSKNAIIKNESKNWLSIKYPKLKASIDITYRPIKNNLRELLIESERLVFKHAIKADQISSNDFVDTKKRVFGSIYDIKGNAASQIQFHVTDSTNNFIKGVLYFRAIPNYDSLLPAVNYIRKDIIKLIETLRWKQKIKPL